MLGREQRTGRVTDDGRSLFLRDLTTVFCGVVVLSVASIYNIRDIIKSTHYQIDNATRDQRQDLPPPASRSRSLHPATMRFHVSSSHTIPIPQLHHHQLTQPDHTHPGPSPNIPHHYHNRRRHSIRPNLPQRPNRQHHRLRIPLLPRRQRPHREPLPKPSKQHQAPSPPEPRRSEIVRQWLRGCQRYQGRGALVLLHF